MSEEYPSVAPRQPHRIDHLLAQRMRDARVSADVSQQELARRVGISFQQLQKYERGINRLSVSRFLRLCDALGADPKSLLTGLVEIAQAAEAAPDTATGDQIAQAA